MEQDLIYKLLRRYASSVKNIRVAFLDFVNYVEDYVKQHVTEETDLLVYWTNPINILQEELEALEKRKLISILRAASGSDTKMTIIVFDHLIAAITKTYEKIQKKADRPFPGYSDLPKYIPPTLFEKRQAPQFIYEFLDKKDFDNKDTNPVKLILIEWQNAPAIVMPSSLDAEMLLRPCLQKLKEILAKDKNMAFYKQHLSQGDPGKQGQVQIFLEQIQKDPFTYFAQLRETQSIYWLWTHLCYIIKENGVDEGEEDHPELSLILCALILEAFANY
jgi:hypothetical protein